MYSRTTQVFSRVGGLQSSWNPWQMSVITKQIVRGREGYYGRGIPRPPSKSKENYVRKPTPRDPWETEFLEEALPRYLTDMKSISVMFQEELQGKLAGMSLEDVYAREHEEQQLGLEWNRQENERVRLIREARQAREAADKQKARELGWTLRDAFRERLKNEREKIVETEKEASKSFITLETLEEAIEKALADVKDYNFAIDRDGNKRYKTFVPVKMLSEQSKTSEDPGPSLDTTTSDR
ncbi:small ribosomal subunit protein mS26-like [Saccoglossus kowalevskii]|uniref:Small ribosomal subunit protein mS26 n=1 Tax=Saccoglossus kowalevskii TaxID=10224 RepID=A0ABM0GQ94_SACKO|nr:PREDICTED: probable 28S ribosomal protein S26, mitochondrial-like [Saccoglossus kowalevskii]